jgi:hypothetical protein
LREAGADLNYRWKQERARGKAEVLAEVHARAKQAGASEEQLTQITDGFTAIAQELLDDRGSRQRRRRFRWPRQDERTGQSIAIDSPPARRALPPGR